MKTILKNVSLLGYAADACTVVIEDEYITGVYKGIVTENADSIIDCRGNLLIPGFYNTHCHPAMSVFRGYVDEVLAGEASEALLQKAQTQLDSEVVYTATLLGICDMLRTGTVSFSDMYYYSDDIASAVYDSGIKANISRKMILSDGLDVRDDIQFVEARRLIEDYHGMGNGRIRCEFSFENIENSNLGSIEEIANYASAMDVGMQVHVSRTKAEQEACVMKHSLTPVALMDKMGVLDSRVTAVHCNWATEKDFEILSSKKASISRCGISNLKLGYGMISLSTARKSGVNITLGTGGAISNNRHDMFREMRLAGLLQRSSGRQRDMILAGDIIEYATRNGAVAQGRNDCGEIKKGSKADLVILNREMIYSEPTYNDCAAVVYGCDAQDVMLTMVDGKTLYHNGEYKTIDIEKLRYRLRKVFSDV